MTLHRYPPQKTTWYPQVGLTRISRAYSKLPTCTSTISLPGSSRCRCLLLYAREHPSRRERPLERPRFFPGSLQTTRKTAQVMTSNFTLIVNLLLRVPPSLKWDTGAMAFTFPTVLASKCLAKQRVKARKESHLPWTCIPDMKESLATLQMEDICRHPRASRKSPVRGNLAQWPSFGGSQRSRSGSVMMKMMIYHQSPRCLQCQFLRAQEH